MATLTLLFIFLYSTVSVAFDPACQRKWGASCKSCLYTNKFGMQEQFYCGPFDHCCENRCCSELENFYKSGKLWLCVSALVFAGFALWLWQCYRRSRKESQATEERTSGTAPDVIIPVFMDTALTRPELQTGYKESETQPLPSYSGGISEGLPPSYSSIFGAMGEEVGRANVDTKMAPDNDDSPSC